MKHAIKTGLNVEKSKSALNQAFGVYSKEYAKYGPYMNWMKPDFAEFGFNVGGIKLRGNFLVVENEINLSMDIPFMARPFQGQALNIIEKEVEIWVAKIKAENV